MSWETTRVRRVGFRIELEKIVGKERPRTDFKHRRTYTPQQTKRAEAEIRKAYREACEEYGDFDGIVAMRMTTYRPLAKSNPKYWVGRADTGKPDWDNIGKIICDALNGIAYKDDQHVVLGTVFKGPRTPYGTKPMVEVEMTHYTERYTKEKDR